MKGAVMKVGQLFGFAAAGLPPEARAALDQLHQSVAPMAPDLAAAVVHDELGRDPDVLFAEWSPWPAAAASIGQVHRAVTHDGVEVAVKVQYPGIADAVGHDLTNASFLGGLLSMVSYRSVDTEALVDELRDRLADELDYRIEAREQRQAAERFAGHPAIRIPAVVDQLSTERVLTSEWVSGWTLDEFDERATQLQRHAAAETVFRFAQGSILRDGVFNADPHPGNYRFHADGTVTFLDFGLVKRWAPGEFERLRPVLDAVLTGDARRTTSAMEQVGFLHPGHGLDPDQVFSVVSAPYLAYLPDAFTFAPGYVASALRGLLDVTGPDAAVIAALDMPPSFVLLDRVVWGVSSLLERLGATGPWRGIVAEYLDGGPPVTDLGRAEARWSAARTG
jgi:predicted unusual protein kinase regulating ubiquinone biosynthesis (AarF/ABC1/UbiB family)